MRARPKITKTADKSGFFLRNCPFLSAVSVVF
nr:MAG TPA: 5-aminolevulinate synthase [Caudoviricetes sp.]